MDKFTVPLLHCNPKESDWRYFKRQMENYLVIVAATDAQKLPLLLNALGRDGLDLFDGLPEPKQSYVDVMNRFDLISLADHLYCYCASNSTKHASHLENQ